ncbi:hydrolase [Halovenus sp. WSH3]|uniref:Hydrolase n=1 Tax=Halovenus carboxidivorans TaxID=2692199 RepID=A0A6B0T1Z4_9EURY|nr:hydrolase [Halovenus carboxidivorans]MXR52248.1 hydrolase [Halovenus carboxidivorans]
MFDEWRVRDPRSEASTEQSATVPGRPEGLAGAETVEYASSFADPRGPDDEIAVLELRGLYAHAEVELSADRLDGDGAVEHDTYFRPLRIPFVPEEETELTVTCHRPTDRFGGIHDTDTVPDEQSTPGIWWGATLETCSLPYIDRIDITPVADSDGARLDLRTTVVTDGPLDDHITYSVRPAGDTNSRGMMQRGSIETDEPGRTVVEHTVDVHDPELWWPRGLGEQHLYTLRAKLGDAERTRTTGICDIEFDDGRLRVNDQPVPIRGINLVTAEEADVDRALECNANLVRAHGHVLPDELYERCMNEGVLVWQDLPLTGPGEFDTDRAKQLATALARQYSRYPCLACTAVHDDPVDAFDDGLGTGTVDRLRFRYRAWRSGYDAGPAEQVAAALPEHRPSVPVVGGPGVGGDVGSYYPGWSYGESEEIGSLLDRFPASVVAEFGAGSVTDAWDGGGVSGFDASKHQRHVDGGTDESQRYQSEVLRRVIEYLRRERTGAIAFALRDTDSAGMGVYAYDGEGKRASEVVRQSFEPVQAFLDTPGDHESELTVVNDTPKGLSATLRWEAGSADGTLDLTVGESGRWTGGPIDIPAEAEQVRLELALDDRRVRNVYDLARWRNAAP